MSLWEIVKFSVKEELDEETLGEKRQRILADDEVLFDGANHGFWDLHPGRPNQAMVCDCGCPDCNGINYIELRKSGDYVLFLPSYKYIIDYLDAEDRYYTFTPPDYVEYKGTPILHKDVYDSLQVHIYSTELKNIKDLSYYESLRLIQWEAPGDFNGDFWLAPKQIFGDFPGPLQLSEKWFAAASEGEVNYWFNILKNIISSSKTDKHIKIRKISKDDKIISLYIDQPEYPEWLCIALFDQSIGLIIEKNFVLEFGKIKDFLD